MRRASQYARERIVFNRPIGQNQAIQHPLAECWMQLEAARLMVFSAAWQSIRANRAGRPPMRQNISLPRPAYACQQAVMTYGGFGYAKEYHVERYLREVLIPRLARFRS